MERIDASRKQWGRPPGGASIAQLDQRLGKLHHHERELLKFLTTMRERARANLADYGRGHSGYKTGKTARAFTAGRICGLLDSIADQYLWSAAGIAEIRA